MATGQIFDVTQLDSNGTLDVGYHDNGSIVFNPEGFGAPYRLSDFCLTFLEQNGTVIEGFRVCVPQVETTKEEVGMLSIVVFHEISQDFTNTLYPTGMLISGIFLLLTLFVYIVDPDLHRPLFGKITIGFVLNNLLAYLCLAIVYIGNKADMERMRVGTMGCVVMGYLTLYTFTSFMLWINAMAANIFFKFSSIMSGAGAPSNSWRKFILYALYTQVTMTQSSNRSWLPLNPSSQGVPLVLCLLVYLVDTIHPCHVTR